MSNDMSPGGVRQWVAPDYSTTTANPHPWRVEGLAITWDLLPWKERDRLVAAACLAILKLEAEARLHDDFRRYVGKTNQKGSRYIQQQLATHDPG